MIYPNYVNMLMRIMIADGVEIKNYDHVANSIDDCLVLGNFTFFRNSYGHDLGFYTWEVRANALNNDMLDIGISNLFLRKEYHGKFDLRKKIVKYLQVKYSPKLARLMWFNLRRNRMRQFKQKGFYALK